MLAYRSASRAFEGRVVHLLGRMTEDTFGLLGPATAALAQSGVEQIVVTIDDTTARALLTGFDDAVELVLIAPRRSPLALSRDMGRAYADALDDRSLKAVHLHGFVAGLIAQPALRRLGGGVPVFYSPHGSRSLESMRGLGLLARTLARPFLGTLQARGIANGAPEGRALQSLQDQPVRLVEAPVADAFLAARGQRATHPLIVTASRSGNVRSVELFAQLAVLLGGEALRVGFTWLGRVEPVSHKRLSAANVGVFDLRSDEDRASRMAAGWIFVALGGGRGFPLSLVEAMAVGLPCVALDTPSHRDIVRHGETGYLCRSRSELMDRIAQLIDTPSLCERMGMAAATEARERFSRNTFFNALRSAYDMRDLNPAGAPAHAAHDPLAELTLEGQRR